MKRLVLLLILLLALPGVAYAQGISQLQQFTSTTSPASAITQTLYGKAFRLSGQSSGCAQFSANGTLTSTGVSCGTGSGGSAFPFTARSYGNSTSTTVGFLNGLFSTASSTFSSSLYLPSLTSGAVGVGTNGLLYGYATTSTINSLDGLTAATQTFSSSVSADIPYTIGWGTSGGTNHTLTLGSDGTALKVPAGGTGWVNIQSGGLLYGNGSNKLSTTTQGTGGQILAWLNNIPSWQSTTTLNIGGNAGTATALAANGTNCSAGNYPLGVDASGNAENCTAAGTGTVTAVTGTYPIISSGGNTPVISTAFGTTTNWGVGNNGFVVTSNGGIPYVAASSSLALPNTALANSTISGVALGTNLNSFSVGSDFTGTSYNGSASVSDWALKMSQAHTWTALQQFNGGASSTGEITATTASTTNLIVSSAGSSGTRCAQFATDGTISASASACAAAGVASIAQNGGGSPQTGVIQFATSSDTNIGLSITDASGCAGTCRIFTLAPSWLSTLAVSRGGTGASNIGKLQVLATDSSGNVISTSTPTANSFFATSTSLASQFPYASTTAITATTASSTNLVTSGIRNALHLGGADGTVSAYGGSANCTNQVVNGISAVGAGNCVTVSNAMLSNSALTVTAGTGLTGGGSISLGGSGSLALSSYLATSSAETGGQLAAWNTTSGTPAKLYSVATSSETCSSGIACTAHTVLSGGGAITFSAPAGSALSIPYASTTMVTFTTASTSNLIVSGAGNGSTQCAQLSANGTLSGTGSACSSGGAGVWPFTTSDTNYNVAVQSTSTPEWFKNGFMASTTSYLANATTTLLTVLDPTSNTTVRTALNIQSNRIQIGPIKYPADYVSSCPTCEYISIDKTALADDSSLVFRDRGNARAEVGMIGDNNLHFKTVSGNYLSESFSDRMVILGTGSAAPGNIGIGNTNPAALLSVGTNNDVLIDYSGNINASSSLTIANTAANGTISVSGLQASGGGSYIRLRDNVQGTYGYFGQNSVINGGTAYSQFDVQNPQTAGTLCLSAGARASATAGSSCDFFISNKGPYIGLGTSTPQWLLQLASSTAPQLTLTDNTAGNVSHWSFLNQLGNLWIGTSSLTTFATSTSGKPNTGFIEFPANGGCVGCTDIHLPLGIDLRNGLYIHATSSGSVTANSYKDVYTAPTGRRAYVQDCFAYNFTTGTVNYRVHLKLGGSYYSTTATSTASTGTAGAPILLGFVLDPGESVSILSDTTSDQIMAHCEIVEFDSSVPFKSVRALAAAAATSTFYTVPTGATAAIVPTSLTLGRTGATGAGVVFSNMSAGAVNEKTFIIPSDQVATNKLNGIALLAFSLSANTVATITYGSSGTTLEIPMGSGWSIGYNIDASMGAQGLIWASVFEH